MSILDRFVSSIFNEVTRVSRYVTVAESSGSGFVVPEPGGLSDRHIQGIHAPGLLVNVPAVIFYRASPESTPSTFTVRLNDTRLTAHTFDHSGAGSWHEMIPVGALKPQDNELIVAVSAGRVRFSDIVILYQSDQLTVKKPLVVSP